MYATKWLWNRLIAGSKYNLSEAILSQDTYFCPSTVGSVHSMVSTIIQGCPYFRTFANRKGCQLLSLSEAKEKQIQLGDDGKVYKTVGYHYPRKIYKCLSRTISTDRNSNYRDSTGETIQAPFLNRRATKDTFIRFKTLLFN